MKEVNNTLDSDWNKLEKQKKDNLDIKWKFLSEFTKSFLAWKDRNRFIDDIINKDSIEDSDLLKRKIKAFKAYSDLIDFRGFQEKDINIYDLRRYIWKHHLKLENSRKSYLENTFSSYDLDENQRKKLESEIKNKSENDLERLIKHELENNKFLTKVFWKKITKTSSIMLLESISDSDYKKRISKLSTEEKEIVEYSQLRLWTLKANDLDIRELFSTSFFNEVEKKEIISKFIPYITLQQAIDFWFVNELEASNKREKILKPLLKKTWIDTSFIDSSIEKTSFSDVKVKSDDFFNNIENLDIIADKVWFANFEGDLKGFKKELEEDVKKNWPQSLKALVSVLWWEEFDNIENIEKFSKWNIIKILSKNSAWETEVNYSKIISISDEWKNIKLMPIWWWVDWEENINLSNYTEEKTYNFTDFIDSFSKKDKKISFYTEEDIENLVKDPESGLKKSGLKQYNQDDLNNNSELAEELKVNHLNYLKKEKEELESSINQIDEEISDLEKSKSKNKIEIVSRVYDLKKRKSLEEEILKEKTKEINELEKSSVSTNILLVSANKVELIKKLDELDQDWKNIVSWDLRTWLFKWMLLESKDWIWEITWVDWELWKVHLKSNAWPESLDFDSFFKAFKENKAKRVLINNLDDLLKNNLKNSKNKDIWDNYEVKNGKLYIKKTDEHDLNKNNKEVDYFVSNDSDYIYKIENISWDKITFKYWERKNINSLSEREKKKYKNNIKLWKDWKPDLKNWEIQYEWELLNLNKNTETVSLSYFNKLINLEKKEFHPDWQTWKTKTTQNPQELQNDIKSKFPTKLFNNLSPLEVFMWWKIMVEWIQEYFKKWNEIHSAKVALKMWRMLPKEVQEELRIKVERAENESMEKEIESLWKVDSPIATWRIEKWLLNKDTPEYKKEAWMLFMLKKYWALTVKWPLYPYRWKFLWYEAFGWRIWDEFYLNIKKECDESWIQFTEEKLMYDFVKAQCKWNWYNWIKRRSRLYKEFQAMWNGWISEELEKWKKDWDMRRTFNQRLEWAFWEIEWGWDANGLGFYKSAIDRWWPLYKMNSFPFVVAFSWIWYDMRSEVSNEWKKISHDYGWLIFTRLLSNTNEIGAFNDTILELSKRYEEIDSIKYSWMYSEALEIFNNQREFDIHPNDKTKAARKFWDKYWKALTRTMHYLNNQDDEFEKTDKVLILEWEKNNVFKRYNSLISIEWWILWDAKFENKDIMDDQFKNSWISGLSYKVLDEIWTLSTEWKFRNWAPALEIWLEIVSEISLIKNRFNRWLYNSEEAKILLKRELTKIYTFVLERASQKNIIDWIFEWRWDVWLPLFRLWLSKYVLEFGRKWFYSKDILEWRSDSFLEEISDNFLSSNIGWDIYTDWSEKDFSKTWLEPLNNTKHKTKSNTDDILAS